MGTTTQTSRVKPIAATNPIIYNLSMPTANTEYSQAIDDSTKKLTVKFRDGAPTFRIAFISGDTAIKYITIPAGCSYSHDNLDLNDVILYISANKSAMIAEIEART